MKQLSRRAFLLRSAAVGGGLLLEVVLPDRGAAETGQAGQAAAGQSPEVTAWILVHPDDTITIRVARGGDGPGQFSPVCRCWSPKSWPATGARCGAEYASTSEHLRRGRIFHTMATGGSRSIRDSQEYLRQAGAAARMMLTEAAALHWGVPLSECVAENSVISHPPTQRQLSFGAVAADAARLPIPADPPLKDPATWETARPACGPVRYPGQGDR